MPFQPTQADLDDYKRRQALQDHPTGPKPVYWGPDANEYSYDRHVREEQEAQDRRERALLTGEISLGGNPTANASADMEAALTERLGMPAPERTDNVPQADLDDYKRRQALQDHPTGPKPVYWGPDANKYSYDRHVREEQEAQDRRERALLTGEISLGGNPTANASADMEAALTERLGMPAPERDNSWTSERISRTLKSFGAMPDSEFYRTKEELDASPTGSPEFEHLRGMFRFYSDDMAEQREAASRQQPPDPNKAQPAPGSIGGQMSVPPDGPDDIYRQVLAEQDEQRRREAARQAAAENSWMQRHRPAQRPTAPPMAEDSYGPREAARQAAAENSWMQRHRPAQRPTAPPMAEDSAPYPPPPPMAESQHQRPMAPPMAEDSYGPRQPVRPTGIQPRPESFRAEPAPKEHPSLNPEINQLRSKRDRLLNYVGMSDAEREADFKRQMAAQPEPTLSPSEKMTETKNDIRRQLMGRNVKALKNEGPGALTSDEQARVTGRLQARGQVDELSSLNGRLAGLQAVNQSERAREEAENSQHSSAMADMRRMQGERKDERLQASGGVSSAQAPSNGHAAMRQNFMRDREAARKENVNSAKAAARTGDKFKAKLTGDDKIDRYVGGAVSSIQNTMTKQQDDLKKKLMAADTASGGKLGYIKGIQEKETAQAAFKAQLKGDKKKAKTDEAKSEKERQWKLEDDKRAAKRDRKTGRQDAATKLEERRYQEGRQDTMWDRTAEEKQKDRESDEAIASGRASAKGPDLAAVKAAMETAQFQLESGQIDQGEYERRIRMGAGLLNSAAGFPDNPPSATVSVEDARIAQAQAKTRAAAKAASSTSRSADTLAKAVINGVMLVDDAMREATKVHGPETAAMLQQKLAAHAQAKRNNAALMADPDSWGGM
jgi:hypothetical protein